MIAQSGPARNRPTNNLSTFLGDIRQLLLTRCSRLPASILTIDSVDCIFGSRLNFENNKWQKTKTSLLTTK
jgi:hypothetical protein